MKKNLVRFARSIVAASVAISLFCALDVSICGAKNTKSYQTEPQPFLTGLHRIPITSNQAHVLLKESNEDKATGSDTQEPDPKQLATRHANMLFGGDDTSFDVRTVQTDT